MGEPMNVIKDQEPALSLETILASIEKAKNSKFIEGIYLNTDGYAAGYATTEAIRRKLNEFKESGKFIIAYNDQFSQKQYYLSSVADSIYVNPYGSIELTGLASQGLFFKNALEKFGVEMQIFRVGTFKSAVEPFMLDKMSAANKEQISVYLNSIWNTILTDISDSRNLSVDQLNKIANDGIAFTEGRELLETGLISGVRYKSEMEGIVRNAAGSESPKYASLKQISSIKQAKSTATDKIAVL